MFLNGQPTSCKENLSMPFSLDTMTFGAEWELGNFDTRTSMVDGAILDHKDNTVVSSTGIANDPKCELYQFGGEILARPCDSPEELAEHYGIVLDSLPNAIVNYRSNLHIHVRVPGLSEDLEACKKLLRYVNTFQQQAFDIVETIPTPDPAQLSPERYEWALKRMKRRKTSHQHKLPEKRVTAMLAATTVQEFYEEHAHRDKNGKPAWFQCPRAAINMRQMWEDTNTIEFRHFPGTTNLKEFESCVRWVQDFMIAALTDETPPYLINMQNDYTFPDFEPYEFETEQVYQWTNFDKNSRKVVKERLEQLRSMIDIDDLNTKSEDVYECALSLSW